MGNEIIGGLLIGLASSIPLLVEGRISGVSGYAASAFPLKTREQKTAALFVLGLVLGGAFWRFFVSALPDFTQDDPPIFIFAIAGLLVGFGSRLGGGCTSGHGVCGLGRVSKRSFASVLVFMGIAILTVFFVGKLS